MKISTKDWAAYIARLSELDKAAGDQMLGWIQRNGFEDTQALLDFAYSLVTKYGEGSATLAAEMYDAIAQMQHAAVEAAVPAATATYGETAAAIRGTMKISENADMVAATTGRLVKQAGADTMMQNAKRDGAYFAWIPSGDTCPFCLMLASNGWQKASKRTIKGDHADHIHAHCNCTFAIRFDNSLEVEGYDPEKYKARYDAAEGDTWQEKINDMRRVDYGQRKEEINVQKQEAYATRKARLSIDTGGHHYKLEEGDTERDVKAKTEYEFITRINDIDVVAQNCGMTHDEVVQIKRHVFFEKHKLYEGYDRFAPDYNMAVAWKRIREGNVKPRDLTLLQHELLESQVEKKYNLTADEAHKIANKQYDWWAQLMEETDGKGEPDGLL
ncbi:MAG: hypothetical protein IJK59_03505 [Firmicutes bacterium]|nr:hypothetical protein [Bacillota bacterium]MBQ6260296.1 hypothetical protein [Bacillota bacterium]MBR0114854.1 hypothetical protein [Bacillota bacterium]MBR0441114.1 hypothetical protein [Bacillota bacterium]